MTYRWAVMVTFAMLSSTGLPAAAGGQSARPTLASTTAAEDDRPEGSSPASRFAAAAAEAQVDLPQRASRPKRSVLEPVTPRWLEEETSQPPKAAPGPQTLPPDFLAPPSGGPAPEVMLEELAPPVGAESPLDMDPTLPRRRHRIFDGMPQIGPARQPMMRDSWQFRPFNISIFEGALFTSAPMVPQFRNNTAYFTGFRVGWDFHTHFGGETRFGFAKAFLLDAAQSTEVGYERLFYFDSNLLYYPFGDTKWRPFFSLGGGLADILIVSNAGGTLHPGAFNLPFGGGIKYRHGSRIAFRADIRDNFTFSGSGGLRSLNNVEILGSIEFHFGGGERRSYWPWNPSRHWW